MREILSNCSSTEKYSSVQYSTMNTAAAWSVVRESRRVILASDGGEID